MRLRFLRLEEMVCWGEGEKENSLGLLDERCEKAALRQRGQLCIVVCMIALPHVSHVQW